MPRNGRRDRHARIHQRERRAAHRAHRRRAVRLERLGHDPDRVRELLRRRDHRLERTLRECTVADVAALGAAHEAGLPDRVGREVVVVHEAPVGLERQVVDPLTLLGGAQREQRHDLRLAAREQARAVRARSRSPTSHVIGRISSGLAAVGPLLLDRDLAPDELLVDRLGGLLHVVLRDRVLAVAGSPSPTAGPTGNGSWTVSTMRSNSSCRFADLSSFESCSASVSARRSVSNCSRTGPRPRAGPAPAPGEAHLRWTWPDVLLGRVHPLGSSRALLGDAPARAGPRRRSARGSAPYSLELGGDVRSSHLGLPARSRSSSCASHSLRISPWARSSASSSVLSGTSSRPPRPSSGLPSCRRRSGRASSPPRSAAASG